MKCAQCSNVSASRPECVPCMYGMCGSLLRMLHLCCPCLSQALALQLASYSLQHCATQVHAIRHCVRESGHVPSRCTGMRNHIRFK